MNNITMLMNADELILSALREDITSETKGTVGEMTFSKIKLSAVPEKLISLMEER